METSNLLDAKFTTVVIRVLNELRKRVKRLSENFSKEIGNKNGDRKHKNEPVKNEEYTK